MKNHPGVMNLEAGSGIEPDERTLIKELFHALNQPLTALQCSLELALQRPRSLEQYQQTLRGALQQAGEAARLAGGIHELWQAGNSQDSDKPQALPLSSLLRETIDDLQPVAETEQVRLELHSQGSGSIFMEPQRLRQALFSLLEFVLSCCLAGATVRLHIAEYGAEIMVETTFAAKGETENLSGRLSFSWTSFSWAMAKRIFAAAGGNLQLCEDSREINIRLRMPRVAIPN